ncbi:cation-transporting P-type ATPase [Dokdonella sp.]|uniref:P-type ATPase n=1 Tax=Dokdonella sp. TaxID=2291710 RepID=UPI0025C0D926|nr:cation-transporting P-type ATPase [Dokdonella sp.]
MNATRPPSIVDLKGLDSTEAARRLASEGPNILPGNLPKSLPGIVAGVLVEPMFLMLLVAGGLYLALGDMAEAIFLLACVFAVIGITLAQERKTQRALESLRDLSAPRALVVRDGEEVRIAGRDVVVGDLLVLHEGDRIAADALLVDGQLDADESPADGRGGAGRQTAGRTVRIPVRRDPGHARRRPRRSDQHCRRNGGGTDWRGPGGNP